MMRWNGFTDDPVFDPAITQPKSGYLPFGALGWYVYKEHHTNGLVDQWQLLGNNLVTMDSNVTSPLPMGTWFNLKMRVETAAGRGNYSFKAWQEGTTEPATWLLTGVDQPGDPTHGCFMLMAHHVDVTFKDVQTSPLGTPLRVDAKAILEGAYAGSGTMNKTLKTNGTLATQFPGVDIPAEAVDTVSVEVRDSADASKGAIQRSRTAWLLTDGTLKTFSDTSKAYVEFSGLDAGNYFIVIHHRNHLAVMSAAAVSLSGTSARYDFTTGQEKAYGTNPMKQLGSGIYGMYSGDANGCWDRNGIRCEWRIRCAQCNGVQHQRCESVGLCDGG